MSHPQFHICLMSRFLDDIGEAYQWGLQSLGYETSYGLSVVSPDRINLLFAGFALPLSEYRKHGMARGININLEQVGSTHPQVVTATNFHLMRQLPNWDYSRRNMSLLPQYGIADMQHVPIGYSPIWERVKHQQQDIDVLFYGSLSPRRRAVLDKLVAAGLRVVFPDTVDSWSREQRDEYIGRAKLVLNMPYYDEVHVLEDVRLSFLYANRKAVVSEIRPDTYAENDMLAGLAGAPIDALPALCVELCADPVRREELANRAYSAIRGRDWLTSLQAAVDNYLEREPIGFLAVKSDLSPPKKLNIGSGKTWKYDCLNLDIMPERGADLIFDLNHSLDHQQVFDSWRFGKIKLAKESFDYILSEHVFEHIQNLTQCMRTCLDLLCDGGILEVEVPYDLSYGAWQDPTHVRAFNERSWLYYTDWCWYLNWRECRFDTVSLVYLLSPYGDELAAQGKSQEEIVRQPRAVDAMRVKLKKRFLTEAEKVHHGQFFREVIDSL
ncbi:Methyltransferase domain-containing protein [Collimonas sp. OK607]|uniref:methyltransferase domain-containing protein n=1 Tax=Collimonas sp. OK607 TaxID=1798194 RepID=UPI0008DF422F|nr:methyltransferase domain-containing protein [Collimonas sp. OK607]SFB24736.1 Methyltransferase domain-containing protein [Collimonas sp. OK607]